MHLKNLGGNWRGARSLFRVFVFVGCFVSALVLSAALFSCASAGKASSSAVLPHNPDVVGGTLDNGMTYSILKNGEPENRIFLRLAVKVGSAFEDDDQLGIAHLIEHMAFNGTAHFRENELIDYFESIGMAFGPEVNAYTSADETVYMLEIPADDSAALETALLVLSDWASTITFDEAELEKERAVVVEEWRLGRGASGRIRDAQVPLLYGGSRYAERLPIGDPEIIRTIPRARILDFYGKWYRPDAMTAIIVGDCDPAEVEAAVKRVLGEVPAKDGAFAPPSYEIPIRTEQAVQVLKDPELSYTMFQIIGQSEPFAIRTEADFRKNLVRRMLFSVFSARLNETLLFPDTPFLDAACGLSRHGRKAAYPYVGVVPKNGQFAEAFDFIMEKVAQLQQFGVTESEAERVRANFLASAEQSWLNRDKIPSSSLASSLLAFTLYGEPSLSADDSYALSKRLIPGITAEDLTAAVREYFPGKGTLLFVTAPESGEASAGIPTEDALLQTWRAWTAPAGLAPYSEDALDRPLFDTDFLVPGEIVSRRVLASADAGSELGDVELWVLSNGARVVVNPTSFKANEILFSAYSPGGLSLVDDAEYMSGAVASDFAEASGLNAFTAAQLEKKLAGKSVSLSVSIDSAWESMSGYSSNADLETLFQLVNLSFNAPEFSEEAWTLLTVSLATEAAQRLASPDEQLSDAVVRLRYGDNVRFQNLTPEAVASLDKDAARSIYLERFADAGDFLFVFTGSFDKDELAALVCQYLAGISLDKPKGERASADSAPNGFRERSDVSRFPPFPAGINAETVRAGIEEQATVFVSYGGLVQASEEDFALFDSFCLLLDIRLRELVRERLGGTYGVSAYGGLSVLPRSEDGNTRQYSLSIQFGCAPDSWRALLSAVQTELDTMTRELASDADIAKLTETYRRTLESGLKNNRFVHGQIVSHVYRGYPLDTLGSSWNRAATVEKITAERMRGMARQFVRPDNFIRAVLVPENYAGD